MAKKFTINGIATGQTIEASQVSQSVQALTSAEAYDIQVSGSLILTGSFIQQSGSAGNVSNIQLKQVAMNTGSALPGSYGFVAIDSSGLLYSASASTGAQGATGTQGTNGSTGTQGAGGVQGNTGPAGSQGATGAPGSNGSQGTAGSAGTQGGSGAQGGSGPVGPQGTEGTNGSAGVQGAEGSNGPQGTDGTKGAPGVGSQGTTGNTGAQGAVGAGGPAGSQGATGAGTQGAQGADGGTGPAGTQGTDGAQGQQGASVTGAQGADGTQGAGGAQGTDGTTGPNGPQGATGADSTVAGPQGANGAQGTNGTAGPQGADGNNGGPGSQGATGGDGPSGPAGPQGATGVGTQGTDGSNGPQGAGGAQGAEGTGGGSATVFNTQRRYKVYQTSDVILELQSTGNYMGGCSWNRINTELFITSSAHGLSNGDVVTYVNTNGVTKSEAVTITDPNIFRVNAANSGATTGTEAAYIPGFSASLTLNGTDSVTAITITAPGSISASAQLNSMKLYASGQGDDIAITFPAPGLNEGAGFAAVNFQSINPMVFAAQKDSGNGTYTTSITPNVKYGRASNQNVATITNVGEFNPMVIKGYTL